MRILFAGSPSIAVPSLKEICSIKGIELAGVLTNPDTPRGRHGKCQPTEVGEAAAEILRQFEGQNRKVFSVFKPLKLDAPLRERITALNPDLLVSFAYGHIFGPKFLALFPLGGINIHPSLLPKYRGPAPIVAAIINRDTVTGISIQKLAYEMDSGDILAKEQFQLTGRETAGELNGITAQKAAVLLREALSKIAESLNSSGKSGLAIQGKPQNHSEASYCSLIKREDGLIDWKAGAAEIEAKIRAFDPWPLCRTVHKEKELYILKAGVFQHEFIYQGERKPGLVLGIDKEGGILVQTGDGILAVTELQYQAKKALFWKDFLNGARDFSVTGQYPTLLG
jgi:methionyl-tRNA formyltransferase